MHRLSKRAAATRKMSEYLEACSVTFYIHIDFMMFLQVCADRLLSIANCKGIQNKHSVLM